MYQLCYGCMISWYFSLLFLYIRNCLPILLNHLKVTAKTSKIQKEINLQLPKKVLLP